MSIGFNVFSVLSLGLLVISIAIFLGGLLSVAYNYSLIIEWDVLSLSSSLLSISLVFDWVSLFFFS